MLTGKRFQLGRATLAVSSHDGIRRAVTIPTGAVVQVVSGPTGEGDGMIDVLWDSQTLTMFEVDVNTRGTEIVDQQASA